MSPYTKNIRDEKELSALAARLAPHLGTGDVVTLTGGLGAGKTAFVRALVNAMSLQREEVPSPTFTLVQTYDLPRFSLWHFDLYRMKEDRRDILELGWDEARRSGVTLVEWPDRLGGLLPKDRLEINIAFHKDSENARAVTLSPCGSWMGRLKKEI